MAICFAIAENSTCIGLKRSRYSALNSEDFAATCQTAQQPHPSQSRGQLLWEFPLTPLLLFTYAQMEHNWSQSPGLFLAQSDAQGAVRLEGATQSVLNQWGPTRVEVHVGRQEQLAVVPRCNQGRKPNELPSLFSSLSKLVVNK